MCHCWSAPQYIMYYSLLKGDNCTVIFLHLLSLWIKRPDISHHSSFTTAVINWIHSSFEVFWWADQSISTSLTTLSASGEPLPESDKRIYGEWTVKLMLCLPFSLCTGLRNYRKLLIYRSRFRLLRFTHFLTVPVSLYELWWSKITSLSFPYDFTMVFDIDQRPWRDCFLCSQ